MDIREWRGDERLAQDEPVASLLRAAAAPSEPGPQPGEDAALAAFRATRQTIGRTPMRSTKMKAAFAAAVSAGVLLTGGIAAAATGTLPGADQLGFGTHENAVGGDHANDHADTRGVSADHVGDSDETTDPTDEVAGTDEKADEDAEGTDSTPTDSTSTQDDADSTDTTAPEHPANHGADVSTVAKSDTSTTGQAHGQAVSDAARANTGQQQHAKSGDSTDSKPADPGAQRSDAGATGATASGAKAENGTRGTARNDAQDPADGAGAQTAR